MGLLCGACLLVACARGYEADPTAAKLDDPLRGETGLEPLPDAGAFEGRPGEQGRAGETCLPGEVASCTCPSGGQGARRCSADQGSAGGGTLAAECVCTDEVQPPMTAREPGRVAGGLCADGQRNGDETDVDCGGAQCPACLPGRMCASSADCSAGTCVAGVCELPADGAAGGSCASTCDQPCFPIGILPCCNELGECGCSWVPGAYCL